MAFYNNKAIVLSTVALIIAVFTLCFYKNKMKTIIIIKNSNRPEVNVDSLFSSKNKNCSEILLIDIKRVNLDLSSYIEEVKEHDHHLKAANIIYGEGYAAQVAGEFGAQYYLANLPHVKTICETGFNAGHSTLLWLTANKNANVYSFDIGVHKYSEVAAERLTKRFSSRLTMTWGDSTKTLPVFVKNNPQVRCDLIIIDGGHSYEVAMADFINFKSMASQNNVVLLDDFPCKSSWCKGPGRMWREKQHSNEVVELAACSSPNDNRGFSIGKYVLS